MNCPARLDLIYLVRLFLEWTRLDYVSRMLVGCLAVGNGMSDYLATLHGFDNALFLEFV